MKKSPETPFSRVDKKLASLLHLRQTIWFSIGWNEVPYWRSVCKQILREVQDDMGGDGKYKHKKSGNSRRSFAERWYVFRRKLVFNNVEAYWKKRRHVWGKTSRRFLKTPRRFWKTIRCFRKRINSFGSVEIFLANVIEILRFALDDKEQGGFFVKGWKDSDRSPFTLTCYQSVS